MDEKVFSAGKVVQVYTQNPNLDTYKCNVCQTNGILDQRYLFSHNKSVNHKRNLMDLRHRTKSRNNERTLSNHSSAEPSVISSENEHSKSGINSRSKSRYRSQSNERLREHRSPLKSSSNQLYRSTDHISSQNLPKNSRSSYFENSKYGSSSLDFGTQNPVEMNSKITENQRTLLSETFTAPKTISSNGSWPQQSTLKVADFIAAGKSVVDKSKPINSIQPQSRPNSVLKSILKKSSTSIYCVDDENLFASTMQLLSSSNSDMHQFYDKNQLESIVVASMRILDYLSIAENLENVQYPNYIQNDIFLLTSQIRRMFEFKSIDISGLTNEQLKSLTNDYMIEMSSVSAIENEKSLVNGGINDSDAQTTVRNKVKAMNSRKNNNNRMPLIDETIGIGTASSNNATNVDCTELLNDIAGTKSKEQFPLIAVVPPSSRPSRRNSITENTHGNDCLILDTIEIDSSTSGTEIESDDDIQFVGTFEYDGY